MTTLTKTAVRHVILDQPLSCFAQMMTAYRVAEEHGATLHLAPGQLATVARMLTE
jgi:hypothetical protein